MALWQRSRLCDEPAGPFSCTKNGWAIPYFPLGVHSSFLFFDISLQIPPKFLQIAVAYLKNAPWVLIRLFQFFFPLKALFFVLIFRYCFIVPYASGPLWILSIIPRFLVKIHLSTLGFCSANMTLTSLF